jgi:hypothetical protein
MQTGGVVYLEGELRRDSRALDRMHLRVLVRRERHWLGPEGIALGPGRLIVAIDTRALQSALPRMLLTCVPRLCSPESVLRCLPKQAEERGRHLGPA